MTEAISPFNTTWTMPWSTGAWSIESIEGMAKVAGEIARQSAMLGYINAFTMYTLVAAAAIPICMLARIPRPQTSS